MKVYVVMAIECWYEEWDEYIDGIYADEVSAKRRADEIDAFAAAYAGEGVGLDAGHAKVIEHELIGGGE